MWCMKSPVTAWLFLSESARPYLNENWTKWERALKFNLWYRRHLSSSFYFKTRSIIFILLTGLFSGGAKSSLFCRVNFLFPQCFALCVNLSITHNSRNSENMASVYEILHIGVFENRDVFMINLHCLFSVFNRIVSASFVNQFEILATNMCVCHIDANILN